MAVFRWCKSEFQNNGIVNVRELPTLIWFDEPFVLEGVETTNLMLIKEFVDIKFKLLESATKFLPVKKEEKQEKIIEFNQPSKFMLEYCDLDVAVEADKRMNHVKEGACNYEVIIDVFTKMNATKRKAFLKELNEATPVMLPLAISSDRYYFDDKSNIFEEIQLELDKPNIKTEIIAVERYPIQEHPTENEEVKIFSKRKLKKKRKKGKVSKDKKGKVKDKTKTKKGKKRKKK